MEPGRHRGRAAGEDATEGSFLQEPEGVIDQLH